MYVIKDIGVSHIFKVNSEGVIFGNFKVQSINDLMSHMSKNDCFLLPRVYADKYSITLKCGHIFHKSCRDTKSMYSKQCPFFKHVALESFRMSNDDVFIIC